jgi:preprotein translocase subunit SecG
MGIVHIILQVLQILIALGLIAVVMSQTNKGQGMGAAIGGGADTGGGGSRFKGGYEEKLDNLARNLAFGFLIVSLIVVTIGRNLLP